MLTKFTCTSKIHSNQSINGREKVGIKKLKNPDAFIDYSQKKTDDVHKYSEDYKSNKEKCQ